MSFAKRFEEARERAGLSVASLAKHLGVSAQSVYLWQQGSVPKAARLRELADLLGVSLQWLMYGSEEPHSLTDPQSSLCRSSTLKPALALAITSLRRMIAW